MTAWADRATWWEILLAAVVLNVVTTGASAALWHLLVRRRSVSSRTRRVTHRDLWLTSSTTLTNAVTLVPAWWAWQQGWIELAPGGLLRAALDLGYLIVGLDLTMYALHRLFHLEPLYGLFHAIHHTDDERMSPVTLFVMHPAEAAGFGAVTGLMMLIHPVSMPGVVAFFVLNLVVGTVAHVPAPDQVHVNWTDSWLGGAALHNDHHRQPDTAFGFFTQLWDRSLGTRSHNTRNQ